MYSKTIQLNSREFLDILEFLILPFINHIMELKMKKFFLLVSILFLFSNFILASDGAAGSGKPVAIKMRKDYLENVIEQEIQKSFVDPISIEYEQDIENYGKLSVASKLRIKISDVLFSRGLLDEGTSPWGSETASRYRVIIFGSLEIESIKSAEFKCGESAKNCTNLTFEETERESLAKYYSKILDSYRYNLTDFDMESDKYDDSKTKEHPNFMLNGYFMPKEDGDGKLDLKMKTISFSTCLAVILQSTAGLFPRLHILN